MEEQTVAAALVNWTSCDRFVLVRQAPHIGCNDKGCLNSLIQQILSERLPHARLLAQNKMAMFSLYFVGKDDNGHRNWERDLEGGSSYFRQLVRGKASGEADI